MDRRAEFIAACEKSDMTVTAVCQEFGISRKTGHKWLNRRREVLSDRSHRPHSSPFQTTSEVEELLILLKAERPRWGPKKLVTLLDWFWPEVKRPAASTASRILKLHDLVEERPERRKQIRRATPLVEASAPGECFSIDHKGHFALRNGRRCYPLTITDNFSRYLLKCTALYGIETKPARLVIEEAFEENGLPERIRTDNGSPFCGNRGLAISSLSLWWMRLGIIHERIASGQPQQNGRHERMHKTLKAEATLKPGFDCRAQQRQFDVFVREYNQERPHEALEMNTPTSMHARSARPLPKHLPPLRYPPHFERYRINRSGQLSIEGQRYFISEVLAQEEVGLEHLPADKLRVWAGHLPLGAVDLPTKCFQIYDEDEQLTANQVLPITPV